MEVVVDSLVKNNEIPIVDITHMGRVTKPVRPWVKKAAYHLIKGITNKGLVLIVNHGITEEKLQKGYRAMKKFCDLPEDTRMLHACRSDQQDYVQCSHQHGYVPPGTDRYVRERMEEIRHTYNVSHKEIYYDSYEPCEPVAGFRDAMNILADEFKRVATILLQLLAVGFDMEPNFFLCKHQRMLSNESDLKNIPSSDNNVNGIGANDISISINETLLRVVYYPPLGDRLVPGMMRSRQRIECGSFTILAQDSEGGLEVFSNGKWQRVGHLPGALLINIGTMMEDWTTGRFKAMKYRVIIPEQRSIRSRGHFNISFHVHPEDLIVPYPVISSTNSIPVNESDCEETLHRSSKWPFALTIVSTYHNIQTRLHNIDVRSILQLIIRRFQRQRPPVHSDCNNINTNEVES